MCCQTFHEITPLKLTNFAGSEYLINGDYFIVSSFQIAVSEVAYNTLQDDMELHVKITCDRPEAFYGTHWEKCSLFRHGNKFKGERGPWKRYMVVEEKRITSLTFGDLRLVS